MQPFIAAGTRSNPGPCLLRFQYTSLLFSYNKNMPSKNIIAVITGANKGIGFEIAHQLAKRGVRVILTARSKERGDTAVKTLAREGLKVEFHELDVDSPESIAVFGRWLESQVHHLDILVNNAGVFGQKVGALTVTGTEVEQVFRTNTLGP